MCTAGGDPHYTTFDQRRYDFMGHCEYVLAKDTGGKFEVLRKNKRCFAGHVTCIYAVTVKLLKIKQKIELLRRGVVKVNGKTKSIPILQNGNCCIISFLLLLEADRSIAQYADICSIFGQYLVNTD